MESLINSSTVSNKKNNLKATPRHGKVDTKHYY